MMIKRRTSFTKPPQSVGRISASHEKTKPVPAGFPRLLEASAGNAERVFLRLPGPSRDELAAEVEEAVPRLGLGPGTVPAGLAGAGEMEDVAAARGQELGDQPAGGAPRQRLGAHEARRRRGERIGERSLELRPCHPRRVAAEGGRRHAREPLLARLAAAPATELDGVAVLDAGGGERLAERRLVELRV